MDTVGEAWARLCAGQCISMYGGSRTRMSVNVLHEQRERGNQEKRGGSYKSESKSNERHED